jgi:putative Ca2+/H+ antiporter (TMEM165/GDT1 family)
MGELINALFLVVVAEMGDKTQLLAMAMASKYKVKDVMLGVFVATIFNHALAVAVGSFLGNQLPTQAIQVVAGVAFVVFGLWTLRGDKIDDEDSKKAKFGPIMTVAIAFFIAEMGDKTQLMTIAISANGSNPFAILTGTTIGMLVADAIGIIGGAWMCRHIPEKYIKWAAGIIFMIFGTWSLYESVPTALINAITIILYFAVVGGLSYLFGVKYTYNGQACDIALAPKESAADISEK